MKTKTKQPNINKERKQKVSVTTCSSHSAFYFSSVGIELFLLWQIVLTLHFCLTSVQIPFTYVILLLCKRRQHCITHISHACPKWLMTIVVFYRVTMNKVFFFSFPFFDFFSFFMWSVVVTFDAKDQRSLESHWGINNVTMRYFTLPTSATRPTNQPTNQPLGNKGPQCAYLPSPDAYHSKCAWNHSTSLFSDSLVSGVLSGLLLWNISSSLYCNFFF